MGSTEKQAEDELREAESRPALLLRQEHHPQDGGQALRVQVRLRPPVPARVQAGRLLQPDRDCAPESGGGRIDKLCTAVIKPPNIMSISNRTYISNLNTPIKVQFC